MRDKGSQAPVAVPGGEGCEQGSPVLLFELPQLLPEPGWEVGSHLGLDRGYLSSGDISVV
jgi:hypothetical protein